ncbi:hypothetical protein GCM10023324_39910 [Streptomyces youssoufiensis]
MFSELPRSRNGSVAAPRAAPAAHHYCTALPNRDGFRHAGIRFESFDYEAREKSAKVVDTPEGAKQTPLQQGTGNKFRPETVRKKDLVRLETPKGSARRAR